MRPNKFTAFMTCFALGTWGSLKGFLKGLGRQSSFGAALLEAWAVPQLPRWKLKSPILPIPVMGIRPWKFKNNVKDDDFRDPEKAVQAKIKGVLLEVSIDKEGNVTKAVLARGGKTDVLACLPELKSAKLDSHIRDAKIFIEAFHPKGEEFTASILHSKPENAEDTIKAYGHPKLYVLSVAKLGGMDTSRYHYSQMRALTELVARKLPQGMVPEQSEGTELEKKQFVERVRKENEVLPAPKCDGVVIYPKEAETKGAVLQRQKFPMTGKFVVMGLTDSEKAKDAVSSLVVGDGEKRLGKVNIGDAGMRTTIKLNPDRYVGKVVQVEYARQTKNGGLINPVLKRFLFAEPPAAVQKWVEEKKVG